MKNVLTNCRVLIDNNINRMDLHICDGVFTEIRPSEGGAESMPGLVLIPTLCNLHAHLGESIFRHINGNDWTLSKYLNYTESFNQRLLPLERHKAWEESARFTIGALRKNGTSVFCAARSAKPCRDDGLCNLSGWPIMDSSKLAAYKSTGLLGFKEYMAKFADDKCAVGVFLHSLYANDAASLRLAVSCMEAGAEFLTVHVAEDETSVVAEINKHGQSAVSILEAYGLLTEKTILVHCGYATEDDLALIAARGAIIAICPRSNQFLKTKMPDVNLLQTLHIPWCLATDGLATGRTLSLFEQASAFHNQFPFISWRCLFEAITQVPARWYSRRIYTGKIEPDTLAEVLAVETEVENTETLLSGLMRGLYRHHYVKC